MSHPALGADRKREGYLGPAFVGLMRICRFRGDKAMVP